MFTNRFSKIVVIALVVVIALFSLSMVPTGSTSTTFIQSEEAIAREYWLGERYGVLPESYTQEQAIREYWLGERYGVLPPKYTYTQEQVDREYFLGERYGQLP